MGAMVARTARLRGREMCMGKEEVAMGLQQVCSLSMCMCFSCMYDIVSVVCAGWGEAGDWGFEFSAAARSNCICAAFLSIRPASSATAHQLGWWTGFCQLMGMHLLLLRIFIKCYTW